MFRVDAGPGIGLGHLHRCFSLAAALAERGCDSTFVHNGGEPVTARVAAAGWPVVPLRGCASWSLQDAEQVIEQIDTREPSIVVVDSDLAVAAYMRRLRAAGVTLCSVADNGDAEVVAHVLLNGDAHARRQVYESQTGDTQFVLGPEYAPLATDYWIAGRRTAAIPARTALLTLGGSDPHRLMPTIIGAAAALPAGMRIHVVVGPFTRQEAAMDAALIALGLRATVHRAPPTMHPIITQCDIAISGAGQTLYELAACGVPTVAIEVAANQRLQLEEFARSGATIRAGAAGDVGIAERAIALAAALAADADRLRSMGAAGQRFIDGQGARRAANALLALHAARVSSVHQL